MMVRAAIPTRTSPASECWALQGERSWGWISLADTLFPSASALCPGERQDPGLEGPGV